ncbi:MAG: hypothetical protein PVG39_02235 [Desulfobacteraceae bacterium]|jgi:hypothetical protein
MPQIKYSSEKIIRIAERLSKEALIAYRDNLVEAKIAEMARLSAISQELEIIETLIKEKK